MIKNKKNSGFTLVELLVVIAIIGILATLIIIQLGNARARARDSKRVSDIQQIRYAMELYFDTNLTYPPSNLDALLPFLTNVPRDPLDNAMYGYTHTLPEAFPFLGYLIWTELEEGGTVLENDHDLGDPSEFAPGHSTGRLSTLPSLPNDPGGKCPDRDLTNNNCIFDIGNK